MENPADVAPSHYQEGGWELLSSEAAWAQCLLPVRVKARPVKAGVLIFNWFYSHIAEGP